MGLGKDHIYGTGHGQFQRCKPTGSLAEQHDLLVLAGQVTRKDWETDYDVHHMLQ
jgi:hypothetical protein